ncbi:MAG TPA: ferritin-like domain-containing protein [Silvibacterium sp.]|nr:ferritin-like domain-containing protein [Silvibacterium sp.]
MKFFTENIDSLRELYVNQLRSMLSAERQITDALPKMIDKSTDQQLRQAFESHLRETEVHVQRLEQILSETANETDDIKCKVLDTMVDETESIVGDIDDGSVRDAALIASGQRVEHFEMASYGTLRNWAQILGESGHAQILNQTLQEEEHADQLLTQISDKVNPSAGSTGKAAAA